MAQKVKIQKYEDECNRYKNELTSSEAENASVKDQCDRVLKDLKRKRAIVDYLKEKRNEVTDEVTELCMKLVSSVTLLTTSFFCLLLPAFVSSIH